MFKEKGTISYLTIFLSYLLIFLVAASIFTIYHFYKRDILQALGQVPASPSPSVEVSKPMTLEEQTAKMCGPIPQELLGIKKSDYIIVEHLAWSPGCDYIGWSISWKVPEQDKLAKGLQPKGVYFYNIPDKKTVLIPLPKGHNFGLFGGWHNDHQMVIISGVSEDSKGALIYDIKTGLYSS